VLPTRKPRRLGRVADWAKRSGHHAARAASAGTKAHPRFWPLRRAAANVEVAGQELRHEAPIDPPRSHRRVEVTGRCGEVAILDDSYEGALLAKRSMRLPIIKPGSTVCPFDSGLSRPVRT
jgi:hypothetical protein